MLPIRVMWDSGVNDLEAQAICAALEEQNKLFPGLNITVYGASAWCKGEYSSADWYINKTMRVSRPFGEQLNADHLQDLVSNEPWQKEDPHIDIVITSRDLTAFDCDDWLNFVFGEADGRVTVQSVARFRQLSDTDRYLAIRAVIHHELGHIYGLAADVSRSNTEYNLGPHCTNYGCLMRQGLGLEEWVIHAREAYRLGRIYCPQCLAEAGKKVL